MYNHGRWNERRKKIDTFVFVPFLWAQWWMTGPVSSVCLSFAAVQSDQGRAPTEKGPVPKLMSNIIQMESLLSVRCAVVWTLLSQTSDCSVSVHPERTGGGGSKVPRDVLDLTVLLQVSWSMIHLLKKKRKKKQYTEWLCSTAASEGFRQKSEEDYPPRWQTWCQCRIKQQVGTEQKPHTHTKKRDCKHQMSTNGRISPSLSITLWSQTEKNERLLSRSSPADRRSSGE